MSYQEDLILSIYGRGEPGLAMADPLPKDDPNKRVPVPSDQPLDSPYRPGKSPMPSRRDLAGVPNFPGGGFTTTSGAFVDLDGEAYYLDGGELIPTGGYDPAIHGDLIPEGGPDRVMIPNEGMMIAKKKKKKGLTIYQEKARRDAMKDMENTIYDPNEGRMGGGFDIINDVLGLDEA